MLFGKYGSSSAPASECSDIGMADEDTKAHLKACITWLDRYFKLSCTTTETEIPALDFGDKG